MILKKFRKNKARLFHILISFGSIVASIAVLATIFLFPVSADEVVYLNKTLSVSDLLAFVNNQNTYIRYSYDNNTDKYISLLGPTRSNYRVNVLPYSASISYFDSGLYSQGVVFTSTESNNQKRILLSLDFPFDFYFDNFSIDFYVLVPSVSISFSSFYLSNGDIISVTPTYTALATDTLENLLETYSDFIDSSYIDYVLDNHYYTTTGNSNIDIGQEMYSYITVSLYKVSINISDLDKTIIDNFSFSYTMASNSVSGSYPRFFPYVYFANGLEAYILSSQDEVYTETLNNQRQIIAQQQQIIDNLEEITGEPPSEAASEFAQEASEFESQKQQAIDNMEIIHEAEELPTMPWDHNGSSGGRPIPVPEDGELDDYNSFFSAFSQFPLITQIISSGCVCLVFYTLLRRA